VNNSASDPSNPELTPPAVEDQSNEGKVGTEEAVGNQGSPWPRSTTRLVLALVGVPVALFLLALVLFEIDDLRFKDRIHQRVSVAGTSVAGKNRLELTSYLQGQNRTLIARSYQVQIRDQNFTFTGEQVGAAVDQVTTSQQVFAQGHEGSWFHRWGQWCARKLVRKDIPIVVKVDAKKVQLLLERWERQAIQTPPFWGNIWIKQGKVAVDYPREGDVVDRKAAIQRLEQLLALPQPPPLSLTTKKQMPPVTKQDWDTALAKAKQILSGPITLTVPNHSQPVSLRADELALAVRSNVQLKPKATVRVFLDTTTLESLLQSFRKKVEEEPKNAGFEVSSKDEIKIIPSKTGTQIDFQASAKALLDAAATPDRRGILPLLENKQPKLTTEQAEKLGIKDLVSSFTTSHPCCKPRVKNIHRIADLLDGVVVLPGATFSINDFVGQRTRAKGFYQAPAIENGKMVKTWGGGISQFATTMFNALFNGGYEVIERKAHRYYFTRYPEGIEATLAFPKPDLIFRNDTQAGVLIKVQYGEKFIRVKLYGDNGGRKIRRKVSRRFEIVPPPIKLVADDSLDPEKQKTKIGGSIGWSVMTHRYITMPDGTQKEEKRKVTYLPQERVVRVHSCRLPKDHEGYTGKPCPKPEKTDDEPKEPGTTPPPDVPAEGTDPDLNPLTKTAVTTRKH
jgi:vancomycin resistance protein YoaR